MKSNSASRNLEYKIMPAEIHVHKFSILGYCLISLYYRFPLFPGGYGSKLFPGRNLKDHLAGIFLFDCNAFNMRTPQAVSKAKWRFLGWRSGGNEVGVWRRNLWRNGGLAEWQVLGPIWRMDVAGYWSIGEFCKTPSNDWIDLRVVNPPLLRNRFEAFE